MEMMSPEMMHGMSIGMIVVSIALLVFLGLFVWLVIFLSGRAETGDLLIAELADRRSDAELQKFFEDSGADLEAGGGTHDTVFVFPDISGYTRFMTGSEFAFAHAQFIIFSLINAMITAATKTVRLSKLEGDAALFFVDAGRLTAQDLDKTLYQIFASFFAERQRLIDANACPCRACKSISDLDLKIFVHRGEAARFEFRGSIDHFGADVIVLHRLMKNGVNNRRYVMVTEAAAQSVAMSFGEAPSYVREEIEHVGEILAAVYPINDQAVVEMIAANSSPPVSKAADLVAKLRGNLTAAFARLRRSAHS